MFGTRPSSVILSVVGLSTGLASACGGSSVNDPPGQGGATGVGGQLGQGGTKNLGGVSAAAGARVEGGSAGATRGGAANGGGGAAVGGAINQGGQPPQCSSPPVGTLCVVTEGGELRVGAALKLTMRAEGCHSSSCTRLISADCNAIGSDGEFYISGFMCLGTEGDACTDDCGGAPIVPCDLDMTLEAGEYSFSIAPYLEPQLRFRVPSHLPGGSLCISPSDG